MAISLLLQLLIDFYSFPLGSSYGSTYYDETTLSSSMDQYMYHRRNSGGNSPAAGHTPKMGHFVLNRSDSVPSVPEEDEDLGSGGGRGARQRHLSDSEASDSGGSNAGLDELDAEDQKKLAACLETILDIVGDSMPEQTVKEAIVRCDFNHEVALNTLLNNPVKVSSGSQSNSSSSQRRRRGEAAAAAAVPVAVPAAKTKNKIHVEELE